MAKKQEYVLKAFNAKGELLRERTASGKRSAQAVFTEMYRAAERFGGYVKAEPDPFVTEKKEVS